MVTNRIRAGNRNSAGVGFVTEKLGLGIKCCELALSSGGARNMGAQIKNAQKAHDTYIVSTFPSMRLGASTNESPT